MMLSLLQARLNPRTLSIIKAPRFSQLRELSFTAKTCRSLRRNTRGYITQATVFGSPPNSIPNFLLRDDLPPPKTAVLLATTEYASLFSPQSKTLIELARSVSGRSGANNYDGTPADVHIVGAIVDGLPGSHLHEVEEYSGPDPLSGATREGTSEKPRKRRKGVSWLLTDEDVEIHPRTFSNSVEETTIPGQGPEAVGTISFELHETSDVSEGFSTQDGKVPELVNIRRTVKVALANTLFSTGSPCTLHYYRGSSDDDAVQRSQALEHQGLRSLTMTFHLPLNKGRNVKNDNGSEDQKRCGPPQINMPLLPLTEPRTVSAGNGNILKYLTPHIGDSSPESSDAFPASKELESAVEVMYRKSAAPRPSPASVFALITPKELASSTNASFPSSQGFITKKRWDEIAGERYYRIRRVVSGGGGWGNKAGLLALDPRGVEGFNIPGSVQGVSHGGGGGLVNVGDRIQFLMAIPPIDDDSTHKFSCDVMAISSGYLDSWSFAKLGESDDYYGTIDNNVEDGTVAGIKFSTITGVENVLMGIFGCASEGGLWVDDTLLDIPGAEVEVYTPNARPMERED